MKRNRKDYVKVIAEMRSISVAAQRMEISQPALSAYLKKLESKLGVMLFDRSQIPLKLTEEGKAYIKYLDGVSARWDDFEKEIEKLKSSQ